MSDTVYEYLLSLGYSEEEAEAALNDLDRDYEMSQIIEQDTEEERREKERLRCSISL